MTKNFICKQCNQKFSRYWCTGATKPGQSTYEFCSRQCSSRSRKASVTIECRFCKGEFQVWPSKASTSKYCNRACKAGQLSVDNKGKIVNKSGIPWNKGLKGVTTAWNKGKPHPKVAGDKNPMWKGGNSGRRSEMSGYRYVAWRQAVFERDDYTCQFCDVRGVTVHADHIKPWSSYKELRYDLTNGRTLCVPCHYYVTFKKKMPSGSLWGAAPRLRRLT